MSRPASPQVEYNTSHPARGYCVIVNQVNFSRATRQATRQGSDVDAERLEATFRRLDFDVVHLRNLKVSELRGVVREYSSKDHSQRDCFALAFMSHGERDVLFCHDGQVGVEEVTLPFRADNCPTLVGKPKLFFFQACRGDQFDHGVEVPDQSAGPDDPEKVSRLPIEADFFFFYSTPPGYFSWKNSAYGSWFMQELCRVLDKHGRQYEFSQLMVCVQRAVASDDHVSNTDRPATSGKKQMPVTVSQLRKLLYLRPKPQ